jgi:hypothetical protein
MKALKILGTAIIILLIGVFGVSLTIDGIVKNNLEEDLSVLMNTEVEVDDVDISILDGSGEIEDLVIKNPEGFSSQNAISIEETSMRIDLRSLFSEQILVHEIIIEEPSVLVEQEGARVNLRDLQSNMGSTNDEESEKTMVIEHLLVEDGTVELSTNIDKKRTTSATVESFELTGIGRDGSDTVQQSVRQIMEPLLQEALTQALKDGAMEQLKDAANELLGG